MRTVGIAISILIIVAGIVVSRLGLVNKEAIDQAVSEVLSTNDTQSDMEGDKDFGRGGVASADLNTSNDSESRSGVSGYEYDGGDKTSISIDSFIYPESVIVEQDEDSIYLTTSDEVETVTMWYEDMIKSLGLNINNFVRTEANGQVLNKMSGEAVDFSFTAVITSEMSSDLVHINLQIK